jgi:hypothetical protein
MMAGLTPTTPRWGVALMVAARGLGIGMSMIPAMSSAYITLPPNLIARATSVSNTVQRVASALAVAVVATILADRIGAELPGLPAGVSASSGGGLAGAHLPAATKTLLLAHAARGFDDTFWVTVGLSLICFPMALLLRRPPRPQAVRAYALRQLAEGVILGAAARRLAARAANGSAPNGHRPAPALRAENAGEVLAGGARSRLDRGLALLRPGSSASGIVPQAPLRPLVWALFAVLMAAALAGSVLAVLHGYQAPALPRIPGA